MCQAVYGLGLVKVVTAVPLELAVTSRTATSQPMCNPLFIASKAPPANSRYQERTHWHQSCQSAQAPHLAAMYSSPPYLSALRALTSLPISNSTLETSMHRISDENGVKHRTVYVCTSRPHVSSFTSLAPPAARRLIRFKREIARVSLV